MDFSYNSEQQQICDSVEKICAGFDDRYWLEHDQSGEFPFEFHQQWAEGGWLGIT